MPIFLTASPWFPAVYLGSETIILPLTIDVTTWVRTASKEELLELINEFPFLMHLPESLKDWLIQNEIPIYCHLALDTAALISHMKGHSLEVLLTHPDKNMRFNIFLDV